MAKTDDPKALGSCVKDLKTATKKRDPASLADALIRLIALEPKRWRKIALLEGVFANTASISWDEDLSAFMKALKALIASHALTGDDLQWVAGILLAYLELGPRLDRIRKRLELAAFFTRSKATQIYRLATFIESQSWLVSPAIQKTAVSGDGYDPVAAMQTSLKEPGVHGSVQPVRSWENMVESVELVLKFLLWKQKNSPFGEIDWHDSPYEAADFKETLLLAGAWQDLQELWADVKFNGWLPKPKEQVTFYVPPDMADLRRKFVSIVRNQKFESHDVSMFVSSPPAFSNDEASIGEIAKAFELPAAGSLWHPSVEAAKRLRDASRETPLLRIVGFYVKHRHYESLVDSLSKGMGPRAITWQEWLSVRNTLAVACEALARSLGDQVRDQDQRIGRSAWVAPLKELANLISLAIKVTAERCEACLELMTLAYGQKGLGIFDQPLLPIGGQAVLVVPSLVILGNPIYSLEHLVLSLRNRGFCEERLTF